MTTPRPRSPRSKFSAKLHSLILALPIVTGSSIQAQTWLTNTAGNTTWSTASWDTGVPLSGTGTVVNFFNGNTTLTSGTIVAHNDISPMVVNQLNVSGVGGATMGTLTLQGNGITFDGTAPQFNINPAYGPGGGYTFNLATPLTFNSPTSITLGGGGGLINTTSASTWNGSGNVTIIGSLTARPLSLFANNATYSGDVTLSGNATVLQLNNVNNSLGLNTTTTQAVTIGDGSGININYNNAAYTNAKNFIVNGSGNAGTNSAALNVTRIGFGNGPIGALAVASNSTVRVQMEIPTEARGITLTRGLVGTADLTKTGNGYLFTNALGGNVTWGGSAFSLYSGNITVNEGVLQTPANIPNTLGTNLAPGNPQSVVVNNRGSVILGAANNAAANPQNFVLNGTGTGYAINTGGINALSTGAVGFGSNPVGSIILQSDASVGTLRTAGAGNIGLSANRGLLGPGTLTITNAYGSNFGTVIVNVASPASQVTSAGTFTTFTGKVVINNGLLSINNATSLGAVSTGQVYLSGAGVFASAISGGINQAFIDRISNAATSTGAIALGAASANDLDFTSYPGLRLGASGASTYSGNLTAGAGGYRLGGGGGTLTVSSALTGSSPLAVGGAVTLTSANNTFSGGITIAGINTATDHAARLNYTAGTGVLPSSNTLTFANTGGTFAYATPINTTETSQALGNLTFSEGFGSVTATTGNATVFGTSTLTFAALTRTAGAAGTLQTTNGVNGTSNKIVVTSLGTTPGFVNKGVFYNTGNYAFNDAAGFLRAPVYGTDSDFVTSGTTTSVASAVHQQISGNITAQGNATFTTLRLSGNAPLNIASGQTVTVDGLLKAGGTGVTIAGPGVLQTSAGGELLINSVDALTIGASIVDNSNSSLTKTGAGALTLTGVATNYNGGTTINQSTLVIGTTATISATGPVLINGGTLQINGNKTVGAVTLKNGLITGTLSGSGVTPSALTPSSTNLQNGGVIAVLAGATAVTKTTEGYVYLSANNTYSGGTNVSAGSLSLVGFGTFGNGTLTISGGRVDLGGKTITNTLGPITGGGSLHNGRVENSGGTYELQNGTITAVLAGTNGLNKTSNGTLTLTANNTYTGPTTLTEGSLVLGATALSGGGLGASKVVLSSGTTLDLSNVIASPVTLSGGLGGNGTVNATGKTLLVAGTFTPGSLSVSGNLTFDPATLTTFVASTAPGVSTALTVTGSVTNSGNLTISPAPSFTFAGNQTFTFASASDGITPGYSGVTANGVALTESPADIWSATDSGLIYTYTENTATLTVASAVVYSPLQLWRNDKFGTYDNTGNAADTFDADGDGISNLMEYALNGNPNAADISILPQITGTGPLKLTFYRNGDANITYIVEARDDLTTGSWVEKYNSFGTTYTPGLFEVTDSGQVGTKRFMRLRVTTP